MRIYERRKLPARLVELRVMIKVQNEIVKAAFIVNRSG